jgi:TRAP-type C4-dicarboxylate transport system substrate-binding protein
MNSAIKNMNFRAATAAAVTALTIVAAGWICGASAQPAQTRIANCTVNDAIYEHIKIVKDELEKRSNGRIKGDLFINCQLGTIPRQLEGMQLGTQDFFTTPPAFAVGVDSRYQVVDAPGLFDDLDHTYRGIRYKPFYDKFMEIGRDKGITPISLWSSGGANYLTLFPMRRADDVKGKKMRVIATKMESALMERHGATGVPITFTEIVPALITRTVDGARTAVMVMASAKMYTAAKYMTHVDDAFITITTWVSNVYLNKLPADLRDMVFAMGKDLEPRMLPLAKADIERGMKELKDNGVEIFRLPPDEHKAWLARSRAISDEFLEGNPATRELYQLLKEGAEKTRS